MLYHVIVDVTVYCVPLVNTISHASSVAAMPVFIHETCAQSHLTPFKRFVSLLVSTSSIASFASKVACALLRTSSPSPTKNITARNNTNTHMPKIIIAMITSMRVKALRDVLFFIYQHEGQNIGMVVYGIRLTTTHNTIYMLWRYSTSVSCHIPAASYIYAGKKVVSF